MRKILILAKREYLAMVVTKAFMVTLAVMPLLMLGGALVPQLLEGRVSLDSKRVVVLDGTGELLPVLQAAVSEYNENAIYDLESGKQTEPKIEVEAGVAENISDAMRADLSDRIREGEIYAFLEIPSDLLEIPGSDSIPEVSFHAENAALSRVKRWFERTISNTVQVERLTRHNVDPQLVQSASRISVTASGLYERSATGEITTAGPQSELAAIFLPLGFVMFMFMVIMLSAQPMLESVMEEKSNRIAEILLGSATPTQIMYGKLLGNVGGSLTIVLIYLTGGLALARYNETLDMIPLRVVPWFLLFQVLAVLMFSSLFLAIGSSVNHLKEAQGLLMPIWILVAAPLFVWFNVVREPTGDFATGLSLVPFFTPMLMVLRMACSAAIPLWQPALGAILTLATTAVCVFGAGRIFRIGVLAQGKTPKFTQLLQWAITG